MKVIMCTKLGECSFSPFWLDVQKNLEWNACRDCRQTAHCYTYASLGGCVRFQQITLMSRCCHSYMMDELRPFPSVLWHCCLDGSKRHVACKKTLHQQSLDVFEDLWGPGLAGSELQKNRPVEQKLKVLVVVVDELKVSQWILYWK